jgi:hypothetical protein
MAAWKNHQRYAFFSKRGRYAFFSNTKDVHFCHICKNVVPNEELHPLIDALI